MGIYIRKSISLGPFRFNLSKSGVGLSVGVRGFRVGMSPRGNYVHMGVGGIYYRATIPREKPASGARRESEPSPVVPRDITLDVMRDIESADTASIVDSSSAELMNEMNLKRKKLRLWPLASILGIFFTLLVLNDVDAPAWGFPTVGILSAIGIAIAAFYDRLRKTTVLLYELDPEVEKRLETLHGAFEQLRSCCKRWHIGAKGRVNDRKYHAGAAAIVRRDAITVGRGNPPYVKTNVATPSLPVGRQTLYFFPDKILVFEPNAVGAVSYDNLLLSVKEQRFIEEDGVPGDAKVVDHTWQFVNRNGGPDRRFKGNKQLPIALYEEMWFRSDTGLNEVVQISRVGLGDLIEAALKNVASVIRPAVQNTQRPSSKVA